MGFKVCYAGYLRVAGGLHGGHRALDGIQVGQDEAVHSGIQGLLDEPLVRLARVGRDTHHWGRIRLESAAIGDTLAVEQELEGGAQVVERQPLVLHFDHDHVVVGIGKVHHLVEVAVPDEPGAEDGLALLEELDDLVVASGGHGDCLLILL